MKGGSNLEIFDTYARRQDELGKLRKLEEQQGRIAGEAISHASPQMYQQMQPQPQRPQEAQMPQMPQMQQLYGVSFSEKASDAARVFQDAQRRKMEEARINQARAQELTFVRSLVPTFDPNLCTCCGKDTDANHSKCSSWGKQAKSSLSEEMVNDLFNMHDNDSSETLDKAEYANFLRAIGLLTDETIAGWVGGTEWTDELVRLNCPDGHITKQAFATIYKGRKDALQKDYISADNYWRRTSAV